MRTGRGSRWAAICGLAIIGSACTDLPGGVPLPMPAPVEPTPIEACAPGDVVVTIGPAKPGCNPDASNPFRVIWPGSDGIEEAAFAFECGELGGTLEWSTAIDPAGQFECYGDGEGHW